MKTRISDTVSFRVARALRKSASKKFSAFTLVELIVVITILAILATIGFLALSGYTQDAREARNAANVRSVMSAISNESAISNQSPRWYVTHGTGSAIADGSLMYVDGKATSLTGGNVGEAPADSNYTAWTPRWTRLKLNPDKFRMAFGNPGTRLSELAVPAFAAGRDPVVGAVDLTRTVSVGKPREETYFQVAGVSAESGKVAVAGNFPAGSFTGTVRVSGSPVEVASFGGLISSAAAGVAATAAAPFLTEAVAGSTGDGSSSSSGGPANSCVTTLPWCDGTSCSLTHAPNSVNQAWAKGAVSCGFSCTGGYSGVDCMTMPKTFSLVKDIRPGTAGALLWYGAVLYDTFALIPANDGTAGTELWRTDGTAGGTSLVKDITIGAGGGFSSAINMTKLWSLLIFAGSDAATWNELWRSDGTNAGTYLLKDITVGVGSTTMSYIGSLTNGWTAIAMFSATTSAEWIELWRTDGTVAGTYLLKDIRPGVNGSNPLFVWAFSDSILLQANDGTAGQELWRTDGTAAGTYLLKDINTGAPNWMPQSLAWTVTTNIGGFALFSAVDASGQRLWKSDGTAVWTVKVSTGSAANIQPNFGTMIGSTYFFNCTDQSTWGICKSDGTAAGTLFLKTVGAVNNITSLWGPSVVFSGNDGSSGVELWVTDGTAVGTSMVKDINPGTAWSAVSIFPTTIGTKAFFSANDGTAGAELWVTDGTAVGTSMVKDINPGITGSSPNRLWVEGSDFFFSANDGTAGVEAWKTDGTAVGTSMVQDLKPWSAGNFFLPFGILNGKQLLNWDNGSGWELFTY